MSQQPVLVIGGCDFLSYHIVRHFVEAPEFSPVSVLSRSATGSTNHIDGVQYMYGDLEDPGSIQRVLGQVRPTVIVHTATPSPIFGTTQDFEKIAVKGTKALIRMALTSPDVQALVYTSSSTMANGHEHLNLDENAPLADTDPKAPAYARTKAIADQMVLQANNPINTPKTGDHSSWAGHLATYTIRLSLCYGTRDVMGISGSLEALRQGQTNFQLGDGKNLWNFCNTQNVGVAHVLAARRSSHPFLRTPRCVVKLSTSTTAKRDHFGRYRG